MVKRVGVKKIKDGLVRTTKTDFGIFIDECRKWTQLYGLRSFDIIYEWKDIDGGRAQSSYNVSTRLCTVTFNKLYDVCTYSEIDIRRTAFHEMTELLMAESATYIKKYAEYNEMVRVVHSVISVLEYTLFPMYLPKYLKKEMKNVYGYNLSDNTVKINIK